MGDVPPRTPGRDDREPSVVRVLLGLAAIALVLIGGLGSIALWWWGGSGDDGSARPRRAPADAVPSDAAPDDAAPDDAAGPAGERGGSALTRTERLQVEAELREVERELEFARGQARAATRPDERDAWSGEASALAARRDRLRARLGR